MPIIRRFIAAGLAASISLSPLAAAAATFNPQRIISDREMRDSTTMGFSEISAFLNSKGGLGRQFDVDPIDGLLKNASQLIYDASRRYQVNPQYILALLQKESSVVETAKPTKRYLDWAAGYGVCDDCKLNDPRLQKYRGLAKQIDYGAGSIDWYMRNAEALGKLQAGEKKTVDGVTYTIDNLATAALYSYTPHNHGNRLLWSIMQRWFGKGADDLNIPDGALVRNARTGAVAVINGGKFRPIVSPSVLASRFNTTNIIDLNEYDFATLQERSVGTPVRFADLSLVRTEDGAIYLLIGSTKRRIPSPEIFRSIGFNPEEVEDASAADLEDYADGEPVGGNAEFPLGQLLQNTKGGVYYVEGGVKHPLFDGALLKSNFPGAALAPATDGALAAIKLGDPVRFAEGTLVKAKDDPTVYLISGGKKRPIPTEEVFLAFGFIFKNVLTATPRAIGLHETGQPLSIAPAASADSAAN